MHSRNTPLPCPCVPSCTDSPNGRRCRVQHCWVLLGVRRRKGWWCFSTSEAEELTGPEHRGEATGGPQPQMVFHLLCLHTEQPSSQLWEAAFRASSDPRGSAFVTTRDPSFSLCSVSVSFLLQFFPPFLLLYLQNINHLPFNFCLLLLPSLPLFPFLFSPQRIFFYQLQRCN